MCARATEQTQRYTRTQYAITGNKPRSHPSPLAGEGGPQSGSGEGCGWRRARYYCRAAPLIRRPLGDTFSRKGRRISNLLISLRDKNAFAFLPQGHSLRPARDEGILFPSPLAGEGGPHSGSGEGCGWRRARYYCRAAPSSVARWAAPSPALGRRLFLRTTRCSLTSNPSLIRRCRTSSMFRFAPA